jgi:CubicO group peptidase (beta-lactamase class C family)
VLRRLGQSAPLQSTDLMCIGSNTKAMSACVIARLVADGRVRWDTTILDALPDLAGELRGEYATVTLAHLLDHKGGMLAFTGMEGDEERFLADLSARNETLPDTLSGRRRFFARWLVSQAVPAGVTPTRDFHYSNAGYALAACMLETLTARSFEAHFEEYMVQQLGRSGHVAAPVRGIGTAAQWPHGPGWRPSRVCTGRRRYRSLAGSDRAGRWLGLPAGRLLHLAALASAGPARAGHPPSRHLRTAAEEHGRARTMPSAG